MDRDLDWAHLGAALKTDREQQGLTQKEVAEGLEVSVSSIQVIERGQSFSKPTRTIRKYADFLNWTERSVDEVLAGGSANHIVYRPGQVEAMGQASPRPAEAELDDQRLPLRIVHELSDDGALLDTTVIKIGKKGRAVVVVKGDPGVTPDELVEELRAWADARARLESDATEPPAAAEGS